MVEENDKVKIIEGKHEGKKGKISNINNVSIDDDEVTTLYKIRLDSGRIIAGVKREYIVEV